MTPPLFSNFLTLQQISVSVADSFFNEYVGGLGKEMVEKNSSLNYLSVFLVAEFSG